MAGTNDIKQFAYDVSANVITQPAYAALTALLADGFTTGIAQSAQLNKVWRQSALISSIIGDLIADVTNQNVVDDGTKPTILGNLLSALSMVGFAHDTGAANIYVITLSPAPVAYYDGMRVTFITANTTTALGPTLNINGLGAVALTFQSGTAILPGQLPINTMIRAAYNSTATRFEVIERPIAIKLQANLTLFVATTGSDSTNTGLTVGSPFATIQKAWNVLAQTYDLNGFVATIQLADGTYTAGLTASGQLIGQFSSGTVIINGNSGTPGSVIISTTSGPAISCSNGAKLSVQNFRLQTTTSGSGLFATQGGLISMGVGIIFGACASSQIGCNTNGIIFINNNYTIVGNTNFHYQIDQSGMISVDQAILVTVSGTPVFSSAFASSLHSSLIYFSTGTSFSGSGTGVRYNVASNSTIESGAGGANFFPGNSAGSASTGGQYL